MKLDKIYDHKKVEQNTYQQWLDNEYFKAGNQGKEPYSIIIPPPNVTGKLHLGHTWDNTLQDMLARFHRLLGKDVLYLPGMDHAGIATQAKVDERLRSMGKSRYDMSREEFLEYAWSWKEEYAGYIREQWSKTGLSLDFSREAFTLDENLNKAVNKVFVDLYNDGLIFRGKRIINWDPQAKTALSNIEVDHREIEGHFWTFKYQIVDSEESLEVATTRPETMFGDVCVVVNPEDTRYQHLIGQKVINPANGQAIPIIGDDYVEIEFGTGAMKCTPAHDPNDFEIGKKYNLEMPICMNTDGTMNELANEFAGQDRFECRKNLVDKIEQDGNLIKVETHIHEVGHSERTNVIVEPYLSEQWFVEMKPLADEVLKYQQADETKINFYPIRFEKTFNHWLENIEDWTISRQLWWGHRIPAWYHNETGEVHVSEEGPSDKENWTQDPDVLDTWFSSALWPFSTLGWPEITEDLERFYPNNVMVTGYDIIFFWVARMAFMGRYLTDTRPFKDVLIHGLVRDEQGRKMSKSLGNGIDPLDVIEEYGIDALRFFLTTNSTPGQDLRYSDEKVKASWNFINKIYNSSRFVLLYLPEDFSLEDVNFDNISSIDRWILNRFNETNKSVNQHMEEYEFAMVGSELQKFIWDDFCSWYIELSKAQLQSEDKEVLQATYSTLLSVLTGIVKMIHPFMPFVSEAIYQALPHAYDSINQERWPELIPNVTEALEVQSLIETIELIRKTRVDFNLKPSLDLKGVLKDTTGQVIELEAGLTTMLYKLAKTELVSEITEETIVVPLSFGTLELLKADLIDIEEEIEKLEKEKLHFEQEILRAQKMLSNQKFVERAPVEKVEEEKSKLANYQHQYQVVVEQLSKLKSDK